MSDDFNPATGLPMASEYGGVDAGGNLFGSSSDSFNDTASSTHNFTNFEIVLIAFSLYCGYVLLEWLGIFGWLDSFF